MGSHVFETFREFFRPSPTSRKPAVGDPVWWAPKEVGCTITEIFADGSIVFQGGRIVRNKRGREVPRWTVAADESVMRYDPGTSMWVVGQGKTPKVVRGQVVRPDPVPMSGKAQGSFAVED